MATDSLPHIESESYNHSIDSKDLENLHLKIDQTYAVLSILTDWVCESASASLSQAFKKQIMPLLFLLMDLTQDTEHLLPEM